MAKCITLICANPDQLYHYNACPPEATCITLIKPNTKQIFHSSVEPICRYNWCPSTDHFRANVIACFYIGSKIVFWWTPIVDVRNVWWLTQKPQAISFWVRYSCWKRYNRAFEMSSLYSFFASKPVSTSRSTIKSFFFWRFSEIQYSSRSASDAWWKNSRIATSNPEQISK